MAESGHRTSENQENQEIKENQTKIKKFQIRIKKTKNYTDSQFLDSDLEFPDFCWVFLDFLIFLIFGGPVARLRHIPGATDSVGDLRKSGKSRNHGKPNKNQEIQNPNQEIENLCNSWSS